MADPLTVLGVAGNVVQFVQFGVSLFSETKEVYRSATGTSDKAILLSTIAKHAYDLCDGMSTSSACAEQIRPLAQEGQGLAKALLLAIEKLQTKGKHKKWESFKVALRGVWSGREVDEFLDKITKLQTQLSIRMQFQMLNNISELQQTISRIEDGHRAFSIENHSTLQSLITKVVDGFRSSADEPRHLELACAKDQESLPLELRSSYNWFHTPAMASYGAHCGELARSLQLLEQVARESASSQTYLSALHFDQFHSRQRTVSKAHRKTFEWLYDDGDVNRQRSSRPCAFRSWLRTGDGFYWIRGKVGSGKSTLMKFIWQNLKTRYHLEFWSQRSRLVTANFFFWHSGTKLQRSQEGLLRSLLFEVLRNCPELIPKAAAASPRVVEGDLEVETLLAAFKAILFENLVVKFCFFIDGLDEYRDDYRTPKDLIDTLQVLAQCPNIKFCVSSRPWMVFADAFGERQSRSLKLEDLTHGDIETYVSDKFYEHSQFLRLEKSNNEVSNLVGEVVSMAQGVFLWVYLVVRDLLEGFTYHDTLATLHRRLMCFPPDLEEYFRKMLDDIPKFYRMETALIFRTALGAYQPLLAITYSFWDDVTSDPGFALRLPMAPFTEEEVTTRIERTRRRLDGRCKGLLEVVSSENQPNAFRQYHVDFLHRTVRDFINESEEAQRITFSSDLQSSRSFELDICRCLLATMKAGPKMEVGRRGPRHFPGVSVRHMHHFASQAEEVLCRDASVREALMAVLEDAETSFHKLTATNVGIAVLDEPAFFLGEACVSGGTSFVQHKLTHPTSPFIPSVAAGRPMLEYALTPEEYSPCPSPAIVRLLLQHGVDVNQMYKGSTVWRRFIQRVQFGAIPAHEKDLVHVMSALIEYGADLDTVLSTSDPIVDTPGYETSIDDEDEGKTATAREVISRLLVSGSELVSSALAKHEKKQARGSSEPAATYGSSKIDSRTMIANVHRAYKLEDIREDEPELATEPSLSSVISRAAICSPAASEGLSQDAGPSTPTTMQRHDSITTANDTAEAAEADSSILGLNEQTATKPGRRRSWLARLVRLGG